jgi:hypothetical protein
MIVPRKIVALALSVAIPSSSLLLSGCASSSDGKLAQAQGTGIGMLGGAAVGFLLGGQKGAAAGAVAGGAAGYAYGTKVAKRKARYAKTEQWLDREIALAREANQKAVAYNRVLGERISILEKRIEAARVSGSQRKIEAVKVSISKVKEETREFEESQEETVADMKIVREDQQAILASNFSSFTQESDAFEQATAERGRLMARLASLQNSIDR